MAEFTRMRQEPRVGRAAAIALCAVLAAAAAAAGCGRVLAPPPPTGAPDVSEFGQVAGDRVVVAAKSARALAELTFTTRRFGSDSTWGYRGADGIAARFRYVRGTADSTRVLMELWGECGDGRRCNRLDARSIFERIRIEDAPPG